MGCLALASELAAACIATPSRARRFFDPPAAPPLRFHPMQSTRDLIIQTDDLAAATHFYGTVLGLPVTHRSERLVGFETGSFCLYVEPGPTPGPVFEFQVPDLPAARQQLLAAGCRVVEEDPALPRCYLRDPFGLVFNLAGRNDAPDATDPD